MLDLGANDLSGAVDENTVAVDDIGLGMCLGGAGDGLQPAGKVIVIGIQPADQFAGSAQKAFVDGIGLAPVGLRDPRTPE